LLLLLFATVPVHAAWAQSDQDRATARNLAIDAQKALGAKDYEKAVDLFGRAEKLFHAPTLLLGLARSYAGLGKYVEARESYNKIIREKLPASASDAFRSAVDDAKREVVGLDEKIAWVTVDVTGSDEPEVKIDDVEVPVAALGVKRAVNPGDHTVTASAAGFATATATFNVESSGEETVSLVLEPDPDAAPSTVGEGTTDSGGPDTVASSGSGLRTAGFVALGVGAAGLIVGGVTGGLAVGKHGELEDSCPGGQCPADQQDTLDSYETLGMVSTIGFIAGGVLAASGLVLVLVAPSDGADSAALDAPTTPHVTAEFGVSQLRATVHW